MTPKRSNGNDRWFVSDRRLSHVVAMLLATLLWFVGLPLAAVSAAEPLPRRERAYGQMIIPYVHRDPQTPPTRTLTEAEATAVLERDWLFQAMDEPLLARARQEIGWAQELAERLAGNMAAVDLTADVRELGELADRVDKMAGEVSVKAPPDGPAEATGAAAAAKPSWIWFPEGDSTRDAPTEARYFRFAFTLPEDATVPKASLRVTADDQCEAFLNGQRLGTNEDWRRVAEYSIENLLAPGRNVLAIRAENRPAPVTANPAGLIANLLVQLRSGQRLRFVSDGSWRASRALLPGWETRDFDDTNWQPARVSAAYGGGPWGQGVNWISGSDEPGIWADPAERELYLAVRRVKRRIALKNPALDFSQLLFIDQPTPAGPVNPEHEAIHRMGITAVPGGRLLVLDGLHPGGAVRQLAPERPGSFWRPDLSFDARRVLFCYKPHDEKSFHLYEINLDGGGLRQLTASDYDDIDPIYLPDGHIVFTTTRGNSHVRCGPFIYSYILARCDADGGNVYLISQNGEPDFVPALMEDGRVIYSRWEYTDKALWRVQSMWTVNPDGTHVSAFWGNQSVWPDHVAQPRQIPGTQQVMFCGVGHHDWWSGSIGILDRSKGMNFPHGLTKVTREQPWPEVGNGPVDPGHSERYHAAGRFTGYNTPYPLNESRFSGLGPRPGPSLPAVSDGRRRQPRVDLRRRSQHPARNAGQTACGPGGACRHRRLAGHGSGSPAAAARHFLQRRRVRRRARPAARFGQVPARLATRPQDLYDLGKDVSPLRPGGFHHSRRRGQTHPGDGARRAGRVGPLPRRLAGRCTSNCWTRTTAACKRCAALRA